jgi:hypothetical protein
VPTKRQPTAIAADAINSVEIAFSGQLATATTRSGRSRSGGDLAVSALDEDEHLAARQYTRSMTLAVAAVDLDLHVASLRLRIT